MVIAALDLHGHGGLARARRAALGRARCAEPVALGHPVEAEAVRVRRAGLAAVTEDQGRLVVAAAAHAARLVHQRAELPLDVRLRREAPVHRVRRRREAQRAALPLAVLERHVEVALLRRGAARGHLLDHAEHLRGRDGDSYPSGGGA